MMLLLLFSLIKYKLKDESKKIRHTVHIILLNNGAVPLNFSPNNRCNTGVLKILAIKASRIAKRNMAIEITPVFLCAFFLSSCPYT